MRDRDLPMSWSSRPGGSGRPRRSSPGSGGAGCQLETCPRWTTRAAFCSASTCSARPWRRSRPGRAARLFAHRRSSAMCNVSSNEKPDRRVEPLEQPIEKPVPVAQPFASARTPSPSTGRRDDELVSADAIRLPRPAGARVSLAAKGSQQGGLSGCPNVLVLRLEAVQIEDRPSFVPRSSATAG